MLCGSGFCCSWSSWHLHTDSESSRLQFRAAQHWFYSASQQMRAPHIWWVQLDVEDRGHRKRYKFFIMFLFCLLLVVYYFPLHIKFETLIFVHNLDSLMIIRKKKLELYSKYWLQLSKEHWSLLDCGKISQGKWQKSSYLAHLTTSPDKTLVNVLCFWHRICYGMLWSFPACNFLSFHDPDECETHVLIVDHTGPIRGAWDSTMCLFHLAEERCLHENDHIGSD